VFGATCTITINVAISVAHCASSISYVQLACQLDQGVGVNLICQASTTNVHHTWFVIDHVNVTHDSTSVSFASTSYSTDVLCGVVVLSLLAVGAVFGGGVASVETAK